MAAPVGFEPTTLALTAPRSAIELWGNVPVPQIRIVACFPKGTDDLLFYAFGTLREQTGATTN
jgi:hypothetical protein